MLIIGRDIGWELLCDLDLTFDHTVVTLTFEILSRQCL